MEDNAVSCQCPDLYFWKNGQCVSCLDDLHKLRSVYNYDPSNELDQCNNSCPDGYYARYENPNWSNGLTASCQPLAPEASIDSMTDKQLLDKYNMLLTYSGYAGSLGSEEKKLFGENPTGADIRNKLHELLDDYYLPKNSEYWWGAQSWCRAKGGKLISREKYFENNAQLRFATSFIAGWNYLRYWADKVIISSDGYVGGRSTTWQSGGSDGAANGVWFICEK